MPGSLGALLILGLTSPKSKQSSPNGNIILGEKLYDIVLSQNLFHTHILAVIGRKSTVWMSYFIA
jgi:hypothetical protein